ncbi:Cytochrome c1, heme protein, mitochondrial, partial [Choanephora cucurbitarum]
MFSRIASQAARHSAKQLGQQTRFASTRAATHSNKQVTGVTAGIIGATALTYMYVDASANMADEGLHPPTHPWPHSGPLSTFDHAAIRRGYQVYREVCSACHSLDRIAWRNLIGVSHTEEEVKAMAEEFE